MIIFSCLLTALSVFIIAWTLMSARAPGSFSGRNTKLRYEDELRLRLQEIDPVYKTFGLLVEEITVLVKLVVDDAFLRNLDHALDICGKYPPWRSEQFMASKLVEGAGAGLTVGGIVFAASRSFEVSGFIGFLAVLFYLFSCIFSQLDQASIRRRSVRSRMSFATDLMALILHAGGTPPEAFDAVAKENANHPLGEEFEMIATLARMGKPRAEALRAFRDRYPDPDISDFVFAVVKSEQLGTPLAVVLNMQAVQMREKHSQWCEKQAAEAGVKMTFPSLLVMVACILVILGPLLLPVIFGVLN